MIPALVTVVVAVAVFNASFGVFLIVHYRRENQS